MFVLRVILCRPKPAAKSAAGHVAEKDKKRAPNRLLVDDATNDDNSVVALSESKVSLTSHPVATAAIVVRVTLLELTVARR